MFPNFCFSRKSNEYGMSVKTLQCLKDTRTTNIKKRKKSPCKSPRRLTGGSCMGTTDGPAVPVNGILKKTMCKKNIKKRSRSSSPVKNNLKEEKQTKNPSNAERSVNFNLSGTKCRCGNCTTTRSDIRRQSEIDCELKRAQFLRMRELQRNRAEQRRQREKRVHDCLKGTDKESDHESSEEYQQQKELSALLEQLREQQQKRLAHFLTNQNRQGEVSEDNDGDGNKRLQESCADFLNIVHDNILETVQTAIQDKLSKYYDSTINKINCLTAQVARNELLLNRINTEVLEKITSQNEVNNNHLKFILQKLSKQKSSQLDEEDHDEHIESSSSNTDRQTGGENMNVWIIDQGKDKQNIIQHQNILDQKQEHQQSTQLQNISQPKPSMNRKNCQCDHHNNHLSRQQQYQQMNTQLAREQFDMQQQVQQYANYQMMLDENKNSNSNMQFPYPMTCQNYLMWLNWNMAAQCSNQNCCQHVKGNTSKKSMLSPAATSTASRTRFKRTCKRFGSASLPNIHATKAKLHARSCLIPPRSSSPRFMNIVNVASQHSEHKEKAR